jgi:hypothetical protein
MLLQEELHEGTNTLLAIVGTLNLYKHHDIEAIRNKHEQHIRYASKHIARY